ncbi:glutathione peroxidase [Ferruginibacter yonginensis]|uniref:Glutathione peroxidase n=1 Tax=Ferruginibacter yonginensis TaxID=1310416 RepID=A0ABV8QSJ4_9BACT
MYKIFIAVLALISCQAAQNQPNQTNNIMSNTTATIHQFSVPALNGSTINFADFKGKKILIVNTASECGYTPQYKELQQLYTQYQQKLVIVGFPANNFGAQEPGSNATIQTFCEKNYGVTFPMAAKISVKGDDMAPIYKWLTSKAHNQVMDASITWNFNKFLLDENGVLLQKFDSDVTPLSSTITSLL